MRALFDVNVLIALFDPAHVHHDRVHDWWAAERNAGWASCPLTQNGFVRVLSQPKYPNRMTTPDAIRRLRDSMHQPEHQFWPDVLSVTDESRFASSRILGPKQVTDIYLLALAVEHGGRLATFDQSVPLSAVPAATESHLVVL